MAVSHVFSNAVADATGTMSIWFGATTATVAASDVVKPSDWNSAHNQIVTLGGNTAGVSTISGTNIVFGGSNNVTLSGIQGANAATINISAAAGGGGSINVSAGTTSNNMTAVTFADSNGVSFGLNGSVVTATVATNYLTTARASNDAIGLATAQSNVTWTANSAGLSLDARGYAGTGTTFNGANISGSITQNSNGLQLSLSAGAGGAGDGVNILAAGTQTANTTGTVLFNDGGGVTFGMANSSVITATVRTDYLSTQSNQNITAANGGFAFQTLSFSNLNGISFGTSAGSAITASHNAITTGRASNDGIGLNTAQTNVTWTVNSSGLSLNAGGYAGTGFTSTTTAGTAVVGTHNTAGLSMGFPVFITNAITTARASTDAIGLNTAQSNVTWTVNSSGLSLDARGYAGTGTTFNGANLSGSMTVNSNGVQLSMSAAAPGGGGLTQGTFYAQSNTTQSSSGTIALSSLNFAGAGIASVGITNGSVVISVPAGGGAGDGGVFAGVSNLGNTAGSTGTVSTGNFVLVGSNGITLSQSTAAAGSHATITILGNATTIGGWEPIQANNNTTWSSMGQNTLYIQKMVADANYSFNNIEVRMSGSFASSTNAQTVVHTIRYGLYSLNTANNSYSSLGSSSLIISASYNSNTAMGYTISQGAGSYTTTSGGTAIASLMTGAKHLYMPFTSTLSEGVPYGVVFHISSASTGSLSAHRMSILNQTVLNNLTIGKVFASSIVASNASHVGDYEQGVLSVTTAALPAAIAKSDMTLAVSQARLYIQFDA